MTTATPLLDNETERPAVGIPLDRQVRPQEFRDYAADADEHGRHWVPIHQDTLRLWAAEVDRLRAQLKIATAGLKHCAGWNISDDKRAALMAVVLESEALLRLNV